MAAPGARKYVGPRLVGGTKTRHGWKRESFTDKRGDISRGDETTNPRRELHLHRRTVLRQTHDRTIEHTHTGTHVTDRHLPFRPLTTPPPFDRRRSARTRSTPSFPLTLELWFTFSFLARSLVSLDKRETPRSDGVFQPLREREISQGSLQRSRQGEGRKEEGEA